MTMLVRFSWARAIAALAVLACAAAAAGCTTLSQGHATPTSTSSSSSEEGTTSSAPTSDESDIEETPGDEELPSHGAPKVQNPLDVSRFEQDPCLALTQAQAQALNVPYPGEPGELAFGKACSWGISGMRSGRVSIDFLSEDPTGLSSAYKSNENGEFAFFEPLEILGFPAVAFDITDGRSSGQCAVGVGTSDTLAFTVNVVLSGVNVGVKDPCEETAKVAEMMLQNMKGS